VADSFLKDAFEHHAWATARLLDACAELSAERLAAAVSGIYGSIAETLRHLVDSDADDAWLAAGGVYSKTHVESLDIEALREQAMRNQGSWARLLAGGVDPTAVLREVDETDGFQREGAVGLRLVQALQHGAEHRTQVCVALASLGISVRLGVWDFGVATGRVVEVMPSA
jgi:uncharacterized damage-inducible protein DinB